MSRRQPLALAEVYTLCQSPLRRAHSEHTEGQVPPRL